MFSARNFKKLLDITGYTEIRLAADSGIPLSTLQTYVSGRALNIPLKNLEKIADTLCCTTDYLLGRTSGDYQIDTAEMYNSIARHIIETVYQGRSATDLSAPPARPDIPGDTGLSVAVWPYNLIREIDKIPDRESPHGFRPGGRIKIPLTQDQENGLSHVISLLPAKKCDILTRHYVRGETYDDIAESYGITRSRVGQITARAVKELRSPDRFCYIEYGLDGIKLKKKQKSLEEREADLNEYEARLDALERELMTRTEEDDISVQEVMGYAVPGNITIDDMRDRGLSIRSYNCLKRTGLSGKPVNTAADVMDLIKLDGEKWNSGIRNLGRYSRDEIETMIFDLTGTRRIRTSEGYEYTLHIGSTPAESNMKG